MRGFNEEGMKMKRLLISFLMTFSLVLGITSVVTAITFRAECDCTDKDCEGLTDLKDLINKWVNGVITNSKNPGQAVYEEFGNLSEKSKRSKKGFSAASTSNIETKIAEHEEKGSKFMNLKNKADTKYKDVYYGIWKREIGYGTIYNVLSPCVLLCKECIGLDKIGHFFQQGWEYYNKYKNGKNGPKEAEKWSKETENGSFGKGTTGVYSNADLAANRKGGKFYEDLANSEGKGFEFDICNYVKQADPEDPSDSWSEEKNPNEYVEKVKEKLPKDKKW